MQSFDFNAFSSDMTEIMKDGILIYLDTLPGDEKSAWHLLPFDPVVPKEPEVKAAYMHYWLYPNLSSRCSSLQYLLQSVSILGLDIDSDQSEEGLRHQIRAKLEGMTDEELVAAGFYGCKWGEPEIHATKQRIAEAMTNSAMSFLQTVLSSEMGDRILIGMAANERDFSQSMAAWFPEQLEKLKYSSIPADLPVQNEDFREFLTKYYTIVG